MKFIVAFALFVVAAEALRYIPTLERTEKRDDRGQFSLRYVSADGTGLSEQGSLKPTKDGKDYVLVKEGEYVFRAPNGQVFRTKYVADVNGFKVIGDHLPKQVLG